MHLVEAHFVGVPHGTPRVAVETEGVGTGSLAMLHTSGSSPGGRSERRGLTSEREVTSEREHGV